MSTKITGKDLRKLVEGLLGEDLPVTDIDKMSATDIKKELGLEPYQNPSLAYLKQIAAKESPGTDLTKKDFEGVFNVQGSTATSRDRAEAALAIYLNTSINRGVRDIIFDAFSGSAYNLSSPSPKKPRKALVDARVTGKQNISNRAKLFLKDFRSALQAAPTPQEKAQVRADYARRLASAKDLSRADLDALSSLFTSYDETGDLPTPDIPQYRTVQQSKFGDQKTFGQIPSATLAVFTNFSKGLTSADQVMQRLLSYSEMFSKALASPNGPEAQKLKNEASQDPGLVLSASMVLKVFSRVVREIESMEAGKFFESFCALLFSGRVVGGEAGASDVIFKANQGQLSIFTSQKLYTNLKGIKQAEGKKDPSGKGVWADTQDDKPIFYFIGIKNQVELAAKVDLYVAGIRRVTGTDTYYLLDKNGNDTEIQVFAPDGQVNIGKAMRLQPAKFKVGTIVTADALDDKQFRSMDKIINQVFDIIGDTAIQAAREVYKKSKTIEVNTTKYSQTDDFSTQMNLADDMVSSYNDLKKSLGDLLTGFSKEQDPAKTQTQSKVGDIKESKKITSDFLKKLIEENFKK
jgi:hypothetical protein